RALATLARGAATALPPPASAPFDHVVLLMLENRSFDHLLGWLPGANGRQPRLTFPDTTGTVYPTYPLAPDFQGCGYADPDHSWEGGVKQLDARRCDGFLNTAAAGTRQAVSFVDPSLGDEGTGTSGDERPRGDIRSGEGLVAGVYHALRLGPQWSKTVLVVNYDEWGGFFDHVPPPLVVDDTTAAPLSPAPHPDYRQLGFRVPCVIASPFAQKRIVSGGAPFEPTSILKMIEWRWGLPPMTARDANARNLAEALDFTSARTDDPAIPLPSPHPSIACGPTSTPAKPPQPVSNGGTPSAGSAGTTAAGSASGTTPATGENSASAIASSAAAVGAGLAARRLG